MEVGGGTVVAHIGVKLNWRARPVCHQVILVGRLKMDKSNLITFREFFQSLHNLWGVKTLNPNTGMECAFRIPSPVSQQSAPGSVPVARDLQLWINLSSVGVEELLPESASVPGMEDGTESVTGMEDGTEPFTGMEDEAILESF